MKWLTNTGLSCEAADSFHSLLLIASSLSSWSSPSSQEQIEAIEKSSSPCSVGRHPLKSSMHTSCISFAKVGDRVEDDKVSSSCSLLPAKNRTASCWFLVFREGWAFSRWFPLFPRTKMPTSLRTIPLLFGSMDILMASPRSAIL